MNQNFLVSIIIPCYNSERYVSRAIKSCAEQSYKDLEILLVDDGSTDSTLEKIFVAASKDSRIKVLTQVNSGACVARNSALESAAGSFVKFLDSDDYLHPKAIERQIDEIRKTEQEHSVVFGRTIVLNEDAVKTGERLSDYKEGRALTFEDLIGRGVSISAVLHRRELLQEYGGFREDLRRGQEAELHLRLALNGVKFVHAAVDCDYQQFHTSAHRISNSTVPFSCWKSQVNSLLEMIQCSPYSEFEPLLRRRQAMLLWASGRKQVRSGNIREAHLFFRFARQIANEPIVVGGRVYRILTSLFGPVTAERLNIFHARLR